MEKYFSDPSLLKDNADDVSEETYMRELTKEELEENRFELQDVSLKEADFEQQKKDFVDEIKQQLDPLKRQKKEILIELKTEMREEKGKLYKMIDRTERRVGYYTSKGILVRERPIAIEENQLSLLHKTGTE